MSTATVYRPGMSKAEEIAMLEAAAKELITSFRDPEHGDDNARAFFIDAEMLNADGTPVPYFKNIFTAQGLERLRKK